MFTPIEKVREVILRSCPELKVNCTGAISSWCGKCQERFYLRIGLPHVMRAVNNLTESGQYRLEMDGTFTIDEYDSVGDLITEELFKWNLRYGFESQEEIVHANLFQILCKNKTPDLPGKE